MEIDCIESGIAESVKAVALLGAYVAESVEVVTLLGAYVLTSSRKLTGGEHTCSLSRRNRNREVVRPLV